MKNGPVSSLTTQSGSPATPTDLPTIHEITPIGKIIKSTVGFILFLVWLLLFIFGMSVQSSTYQNIIIKDHSLNFMNLLLYAVTFTPTNTAALASLAGILGGFASNLAADNQYRQLRPTTLNLKSAELATYLYMTENPLVSMLRGFITYLIFIAGSYLTNFTISTDTNGNFMGLTASSYFKFAVSVSLLAYLAGYDPSRMKGLIDSVSFARKDPPPPTQATTVTHTESVEVATNVPPRTVNGQTGK
jgi:hypothetical protein